MSGSSTTGTPLAAAAGLTNRPRELLLWDSAGDPPDGSSCIYLWNGYSERDGGHSLLRYCELHAERLRAKYLAWIHDVGEILIRGKSIIDHLALDDGLSYWWMTLLVEKSPYKSPLTDAIRLLAVEEIIAEYKPERVHIVTKNRPLHQAVKVLCKGADVVYAGSRPQGSSFGVTSIEEVFRFLPESVQALISLARYVWAHRKLGNATKRSWVVGDKALFFCSYFFNFSPEDARAGRLRSRYWGGLHQLVRSMGIRGNWLHLYVPHDAVPNAESGNSLTRSLNLNHEQEGVHAFLESYLTWSMVLCVLKRWFELNLVRWRLRSINNAFKPTRPRSYLWPLMQQGWNRSLVGTFSINNLFLIELFDASLHEAPHQKRGLYLCENQSWERALIYAWRKHGHGQLIAVPHSTVRFWDLRYFSDPRTLRYSGTHPLPQPDLSALNGRAAVDAYRKAGYPGDAIVECEALRFEYLNKNRVCDTPPRSTGASIKLLILGEYSPVGTAKLLELLEMTVQEMSARVVCTLKPHPSCIVKAADYPLLNLDIIADPLGEILSAFDVVYAANMTSAAVDAYLSNMPVVVMLDPTELNFSPLRGQPGVHFASTSEELAFELLAASQLKLTRAGIEEFFFLDSEFSRWKKILQVQSGTAAS